MGVCSIMWSLSITHMDEFFVFLACSFFQHWSLLSLLKYLGAGPLLGPCPRPFFLGPVSVGSGLLGVWGLIFRLGPFPFITTSAFGCQLAC